MDIRSRVKRRSKMGAILCLCGICLLQTGCKNSETSTVQKYTHMDTAMGTIITETMYGGSEVFIAGGIDRLRELEDNILSWRVKDSEIYIVNKNAGSDTYTEISTELAEYLAKTLKVSEDSKGALDPTIGKITRLWDIGGENPQIPEETELQTLLTYVGYDKIEMDSNQVKLPENVSIDLGAVGKGIGADVMKLYMDENEEVKAGVIAVGGSILTYGTKPDHTPWKVSIQDPRGGTNELAILELYGEHHISTSGNYEKFFVEDGVTYHHILNPETGYPAESGLISVTIVCDSGLLSDALSTACFVLGYENSLEIVSKYNAEAVFVDEDNNIYVTQGLMECISVSNELYTVYEID